MHALTTLSLMTLSLMTLSLTTPPREIRGPWRWLRCWARSSPRLWQCSWRCAMTVDLSTIPCASAGAALQVRRWDVNVVWLSLRELGWLAWLCVYYLCDNTSRD